MHLDAVYASGFSGFIGKNLRLALLKKFPKVINFRRGGVHEIYSSDGSVKVVDNKYFIPTVGSKLFINAAALYNATPRSQKELSDLYLSNTTLPIELIDNYIGSKNLKIIQLASYFQLVDLQFQTPYSLTKSLGMKYMENNYENLSFVYLFDTFGTNDNRNRVIDTFINNIIDRKSIILPLKDLYINISHVSDICKAIVSCIDLPATSYCVMSENTLSLRCIAKKIMELVGNTVEVQTLPDTIDYFAQIDENNLPKNIFPLSKNKNFVDQLRSRIIELKASRLE